MKLRISCVSDVGRIRDNNEDMASAGMYLIRDNSLNIEKEVTENETFCLLVSDGMGGHESGEYASQFTLETLRAYLLDKSLEHHNPIFELKLKIESISANLNAKACERHQGKAMGCTLTGIVWMQGKTLLVNIGDSRTYRLRDGMLRQLTSDQTSRKGYGSASGRQGLVQLHWSGLRHRGLHSGHHRPADGVGQDPYLL